MALLTKSLKTKGGTTITFTWEVGRIDEAEVTMEFPYGGVMAFKLVEKVDTSHTRRGR